MTLETPNDLTALSDARVGATGVVELVDLPEEVSHYLAHLGFLPGTSIEVLRQAPAGDPRVYRLDGVEVGLRKETARHIFLRVQSLAAVTPAPVHEAQKSLKNKTKGEARELNSAGVAA